MNRQQRGVNTLERINGILSEQNEVELKETVALDHTHTPLSPEPPSIYSGHTETMDQHKEELQQQQEEEDHSKESTDHQKEEEKEMDTAEEPMVENKEKSSGGLTDQHKVAAAAAEEEEEQEEERSSESEEAMAAWSVFAHPCSLLQYMVRACATWLWLPESLGGTKPSAASPHALADSPQERDEDTKTSTTGSCMQEVITRSRAVLKVRRPAPPGNPREGSGGNGGQHH